MSTQPFSLKGEMTLLNVMVLQSVDINTIHSSLDSKRQEISQLLSKSPVIVDCQNLGENCSELDFIALHKLLVEFGFVPVGIRNIPEDIEEPVQAAGWSVLRSGAHANRPAPMPVPTEPLEKKDKESKSDSNEEAPPRSLILLEKPVRSGQQVYAKTGDIVVMQMTSAGSELLAAGSVHVYGSLRGRVLAGIFGDTSARIFCQKLEAELVAIAGRYRLLDDIDTNLKGKPAMIYLEGEKLMIEPMF